MNEYKELFGIIGTLLAFIGFVPYVRNILMGKTKPHAFSWLIWALLMGIAFLIQFSEGAGPGSWPTGIGSLLCFLIFFLALLKGDRNFSLFDWSVLMTAVLIIILWHLTNNPTLAIVLATLSDVIGYIPTFKKGYRYPFEETTVIFVLSIVGWSFALLAIENFIFVNWLYPVALLCVDTVLVTMLFLRRRQLTTRIQN